MTHSGQLWRHPLFLFVCALVFVTVGSVSADAPEQIQPPTSTENPYADIHAAIEQADDWATIAELAQELPFEQQARFAQAYIQSADLSTTPPLDERNEQEMIAANEADEARNATRAVQVRAHNTNLLDAEKLETPAGDGSSNRAAAILTVGDSCTYANVQAAVNAASSGDTIRVQARTWTGSSATINVNGKSLTFIGGYNSTCSSLTSDKTILDATGTVDSVVEIYGSASTVYFEDFEFRGGENDADYGGGIEIDDGHTVTLDSVFVVDNASTFGGGIHMGDSTLTMQNSSKVTLNNATEDGGGIFCTNGTINVNGTSYVGFWFLFISEPNSADSDENNDGNGGGIYADGCTVNLGSSGLGGVLNNDAYNGGGIYAIANSTVNLHDEGGGSVSINRATNSGGGIYLSGGSDLYVDNSFVSSNSAENAAGGVYASGTGTIADFDSNSSCSQSTCANLSNNSATGLGGGAYVTNGAHLDLKSVYAHDNSSGNFGNVVYAIRNNTTLDFDSVFMTDGSGPNQVIRLFDQVYATLDAVTIAGLDSFTAGDEVFGVAGNSHLDIWGSIIWDVGAAGMFDGNGEITIDCSITHEPFLGSSNEVADPLFLDPDNGNYHISRNSPAVDQCDSSYSRDVDYELRPNGIVGVGTARHRLDEIPRDSGRSAADVQPIIVYPDELDAPLFELVDSVVRVVDYGSYLWVELSDSQARSLAFPHTVVENFGRIQFNNFAFDPLTEGEPTRSAALTNAAGAGLHFVQLASPATEDDLDAFESSVKLIQYYPFNTYLVWGTSAEIAKLQTQTDNIRWTGNFHSDYRLAHQLAEKLPQRGTAAISVDALLLDDGELATVAKTIDELGGQLTNTMNRHVMNETMRATIWQITLPASQVSSLITLPQLIHVDSTPVDQILDERSNQIIADNVPGVDPETGYADWLDDTGYDGNGVTVAVVDSGVDWDHPDLNVVSGNEYGGYSEAGEPGSDGGPDSNGDSRGSGHGTHVAGIVAGDGGTGTADGDGFIYGQGVAPGASLHAQDGIAEDGGTDRETRINDSATNADLSNNSWGADPGQGYNSGAANHDDWTLDAINNGTSPATAFLAVFAAGNQGASGITDPGEAKNLLVVASSDSDRSNTSGGEAGNIDNISGFSSRGLAADGRIKPDVAAPGRNIISTQNTNGTTVSCDGGVGNPPGTSTQHSFCTGTSMASPHVAGAAALFTEYWRDSHNSDTLDPHPSLVKAAIINTTDDMGGRPDGNEGWGRVNIDRMLNPPVPVVYYPTPDLFQNNGEEWSIEVRPADTNEPLRITLYWDDAPGANNANPALVNDLYLRLQEEGGTLWRGNVFAADGWSTTGGSNDTLNNVENVWIEEPDDIVYTVDVIAQSLNGDAQYYNGDATDQHWSLVCYNCDVVIEGLHDAGADEVYAQVGLNGVACGHASVTDAIAAASDGDTIYIPSGTYKEVLGDIDKDLTFVAAENSCLTENASADSYAVTIDADDGGARTWGGVAQILTGAEVTFRHVYMVDGSASYGGILYVNSGATATLDDANVGYGNASLFGGGVRSVGTLELINNSWLFSNTAPDGGGLAIAGGTTNVRTGSDIGYVGFPNSATANGGNVHMSGGRLNLYDTSTIVAGSADGNGGGIYASDSADIVLYDTAQIGGLSTSATNSATNGGGVYLTGLGTTMSMSSGNDIRNNSATDNGGGVAVFEQATFEANGGDIYDNSAELYGGGIYVDSNDLATAVTLQNGATVRDNSADLGGGAYLVNDNTTFTVIDSAINDNTARWGGGVRLNGSSTFALTNSAISGNDATSGNGGGLAIDSGGSFEATDLDMRSNFAGNSGGGIYNVDGTVTLTAVNTTNYIALNNALNSGGGIFDDSGNTLRIEATSDAQFNLNTNSASNSGGAVFVADGTYFWPRGAIQIGSNTASLHGGGVYVDGATMFIDDFGEYRPNLIGNTAISGNGGAAYGINSTRFEFNGVDVGASNSAVDGGGIYMDNSTGKLITSHVHSNIASDDGGGVAIVNASDLLIETTFPVIPRSTSCDAFTLSANEYCSMIDGNTAGDIGGGLYISDSTLTAEYVAIVNNTNSGWGSAMSLIGTSSGSLTSSLVANNATSSTNNTAVHVYTEASLDLLQNTIVDNDDFGVSYALGATGNVDGNIIWGNTQRGAISDASPTCNNTQNGAFSGGSGNISANPLFETTARGDYRLGAGSPSLDACVGGPSEDLDGTARALGDSYDMGAFEGLAIPTAVTMQENVATAQTTLVLLIAVGGVLMLTLAVARKRD